MRAGQEAILAEMRRWGYRFVVTSTLESLDVLELGLGPEASLATETVFSPTRASTLPSASVSLKRRRRWSSSRPSASTSSRSTPGVMTKR